MTRHRRRAGVRGATGACVVALVTSGALIGAFPDGAPQGTATATAPVPREPAREPAAATKASAATKKASKTATKAARPPARAAAAAEPAPPPARRIAPGLPGRKGAGPPLSITIPSLGISQTLIGLRVARDGTLEVPEDIMDIGWWGKGPAPGEPGGAVVVGHNSWNGQPAIFAELAGLRPGAKVTVDRPDGSIATYRVTHRRQFSKNDFPDDLVYRYTGPSALHLVTCGGTFDSANRRWTDNVVVFANLVSDTRKTS